MQNSRLKIDLWNKHITLPELCRENSYIYGAFYIKREREKKRKIILAYIQTFSAIPTPPSLFEHINLCALSAFTFNWIPIHIHMKGSNTHIIIIKSCNSSCELSHTLRYPVEALIIFHKSPTDTKRELDRVRKNTMQFILL